jgi:K+-sensing histidine kinase KdpD
MQLGYELIKEQIFFRRELRERVFWFIHLRWAAVGVGLLGCWVAFLAGELLEFQALVAILLGIACYNMIFLFLGAHMQAETRNVGSFILFAHVQICLDLLALLLVLHFTGGSSSPLLVFVVFHIVLAGILLSRRSCFLYAAAVILALAGMIWLERTGSLPPRTFLQGQAEVLWARYGALAVALLVGAFLITQVVHSLRLKGRELLRVSAELESTSSRLRALYDMVKEMGGETDLQKLMDSATRLAATIMGVKACSIKLLDDEQRYLRFASTYGLSQDYLSKGAVEVARSPINQKIIEGAFYAIGSIREKDYFQYPEDIQREGIVSMLCLPLKVEKRILGVFCVYSDQSYHFGERDTAFFSLMTDLTALAIERLRGELTKAWFFHKAAHQLRSPLHALLSMFRVLKDGYLGPLNQKQAEAVARCETRIRLMGELIEDLLRLGQRRSETSPRPMKPMNLGEALRQVSSLYAQQAKDKGICFQMDLQEPVPDVLAEQAMVDELLTNLISNAIKYTPEGGTVRVSLAKEGRGWLRLEVSDTGIGIPKEELPHLFTEFFRASNARAMVEQGTGLGLVIVKEALSRMRGSIQVKSREAEGTTFTCLIPSILQPQEP